MMKSPWVRVLNSKVCSVLHLPWTVKSEPMRCIWLSRMEWKAEILSVHLHVSYTTVLSVGETRPEKDIRLCWKSIIAMHPFQSWLKSSFFSISLSKGDGVVFNNWGKLKAVDLNGLTHSFSLIVNYLQKPSSPLWWIPMTTIQWNEIFELVFLRSSSDYDKIITTELCLKRYQVDGWKMQKKRECIHFLTQSYTPSYISQHDFKAVIHVFICSNIESPITNLIYLSLMAIKSAVNFVSLVAAHLKLRFERTTNWALWNDCNAALHSTCRR